jgi:hypothetical protein
MSPNTAPERLASHATRDAGSVRAALLAGFAVVFGLWLLWGYQLVHNFQRIEQNVTSLHESFMRGEQTLSRIRTNVLLGSIFLRDALIDGTGSRSDVYRAEFTRLRTEADRLLDSYLPDVSSEQEREHWLRLQVELANYWASRSRKRWTPGWRRPSSCACTASFRRR